MAKNQTDSSLKKIHLEPIPVYYPKIQGDFLVDRADENELRTVFNKVIKNVNRYIRNCYFIQFFCY
jgi:hypothetical protein